jgi:hypothetical protein
MFAVPGRRRLVAPVTVALPLSDANLNVARLEQPTEQLGTGWFQMAGLEQALDDPAAVT